MKAIHQRYTLASNWTLRTTLSMYYEEKIVVNDFETSMFVSAKKRSKYAYKHLEHIFV